LKSVTLGGICPSAQTTMEGVQSITNDIDVQSTTSITLKEHNKAETSS